MSNHNLLNKKEITRKSKLTIYRTSYVSIVTYGCETWPVSSKHNSQMQATEMRSLRKIEGQTPRHRISIQTVRMGLGIIPIKYVIELAQLRWFGHVVKMGDERYPEMT